MNENFVWLVAAIALATIHSGGSTPGDDDEIHSSIGDDARNVVAGKDNRQYVDHIGRDQIIYARQDVWRQYIDEELRSLRDEMMALKRGQSYQWITISLLALAIMFSVVIAGGVISRRFDLLDAGIERQFDLIDAKLQRQFDYLQRQLDRRVP